MEQTSNLVAYLRTRSGGREVLTPKQLEPILGISAKHQSLLRKENKLKIPYLVVGGKILYSIHAVADMLTRPAENEPAPAKNTKVEKATSSKTKAEDKWRSNLKVPSSQPVNMSQSLLRAFVLNNIKAEILSLAELSRELQVLQDYDALRTELTKGSAPNETSTKLRLKI